MEAAAARPLYRFESLVGARNLCMLVCTLRAGTLLWELSGFLSGRGA